MKYLVVLVSLLLTSKSFAEDITCEKSHNDSHRVHCKAKKVTDVSLVNINGGECNAPSFHWHGSGEFSIPGSKECGYTSAITLLVNGKQKLFAPL